MHDGGSEQELHMGLCLLPVCHRDPVCSHILYSSKQNWFLSRIPAPVLFLVSFPVFLFLGRSTLVSDAASHVH